MKGLRNVGIVCVVLGLLGGCFLALQEQLFRLTNPGQARLGMTLGPYWTSSEFKFEVLVVIVLLAFGVGFIAWARQEG